MVMQNEDTFPKQNSDDTWSSGPMALTNGINHALQCVSNGDYVPQRYTPQWVCEALCAHLISIAVHGDNAFQVFGKLPVGCKGKLTPSVVLFSRPFCLFAFLFIRQN